MFGGRQVQVPFFHIQKRLNFYVAKLSFFYLNDLAYLKAPVG